MITIVTYDLSISTFSLRGLPYKFEIFTGFAVVILLLGLVRILRRWQGIKDMRKFGSFSFKTSLSPSAIQYARLFTLVEIFFLLSVLIFCLSLQKMNPEQTFPMIIALGLILIEMILFLLMIRQNASSFQLGLNNKVLAYFNREMHLYFYTGLKKVELHTDDLINFEYKEDLNLSFPTNIIRKEDRVAFRNALIAALEGKNVYIDDALRNWE